MEQFGEGQELITFDDAYQTGSECPKSGTWVCKNHPYVEIHISEGKKFPSCSRSHRAIWWYMKRGNE